MLAVSTANILPPLMDRSPVVKTVKAHLSNLDSDFNQYFHDTEAKAEKVDLVRNPFSVNENSSSSLPANLQENLMHLSSDRGLKACHMLKNH